MTRVTLPWPRGTLHPNGRPHWAVKARHTALARADALIACRAAGLRPSGAERVRLRLELFPPDRRRRDLPDAISALKASIDGIADALGVDDSRFVWDMPEAFSEPVKGGSVVIEIEPAEGFTNGEAV